VSRSSEVGSPDAPSRVFRASLCWRLVHTPIAQDRRGGDAHIVGYYSNVGRPVTLHFYSMQQVSMPIQNMESMC
jgi:hypothetical protein